jgi:Protein of unknown function (DUF3500)
MKLTRIMLAGVAMIGLVAVVVVGQNTEQTATKMASAADKFLGSLTPQQKKKATFGFDDKERVNWHFIPMQTEDRKPTRKGLPLQEMTAAQRQTARELLQTGTSATGFLQAQTIMSLEAILRELEKPKGRMVRNSDWYFFTVFGNPSRTGKWGWRVEGHHLSLNFTLDKGKLISATPSFFGANPATIKQGPRQGYQTLREEVALARSLFDALDEGQKKIALQPKSFPEVEQGKAKPNVGAARGLAVAKMKPKQKDLLVRLVRVYAGRMPPEAARVELGRVEKAGIDKIHFAFTEEAARPGKPYTYRVQGPTFVIEFLNVQPDSGGNPANHIHSVWRNLAGDFGTGD